MGGALTSWSASPEQPRTARYPTFRPVHSSVPPAATGSRGCSVCLPGEVARMMGLLGGDPGPGPESRFVYPEVVVSVGLAGSALARPAVLVLVLAGVLGLVAVAVLVVVVFPAGWSRRQGPGYGAP